MQRRKIFLISLAIGLGIFLLIPLNNMCAATITAPASPSKEEITNFGVMQTFQPEGSILAEEKITFYCGGAVIQNGLVRTFAKQMVDNEKKVSKLLVSAFTLKLDGKTEKFSVQEDTTSIYVYMGDIAKKLTKGAHVFDLTYKINGIIKPYSYNYDKYFFFPLGGWDLPIESATITIKVPAGKNVTLLQPKMFKEAATEQAFPSTVFYLSRALLKGELLLVPKEPIAGGDVLALAIMIPKNFIAVGGSKNFYFGFWGFYIFAAGLLLFSLYVFLHKNPKAKTLQTMEKNKKIYFRDWGFYLFAAGPLLFSRYIFLHKTPKANTLQTVEKNKKWYIFSRATILLADFLSLFFIFNKENADMIFWLLTIFLLLAIEIILTTEYKGTNKNFRFFKYGITSLATFFYCFALLSFIYKIQGLILLLIIISQILFLNRKKETR